MIVNTEFSEAVVESLHDVTPTVRELRIRPIAHKPVPHDPGAHLQVALHAAPDQPNAPGVGLIRRR